MQTVVSAQTSYQYASTRSKGDPYNFRINEQTTNYHKTSLLKLGNNKDILNYTNRYAGNNAKQVLPNVTLPDARRWAMQILLACLEVVSGLRPAHSLVRWCNKELLDQLMRQRNLVLDINKQAKAKFPRLKTHFAKATYPHKGVAEVSMLISIDQKMKACALRLEASENRWKIIALEIG